MITLSALGVAAIVVVAFCAGVLAALMAVNHVMNSTPF